MGYQNGYDVNFNGSYNYYNTVTPITSAANYTLSSTVNEVNDDSIFAGAGLTAAVIAVPQTIKAVRSTVKSGKGAGAIFTEYGSALKNTNITKQTVLSKDTYINLAKTGTKNASVNAASQCIPGAEKLAKMTPEAQKAFTKAQEFITKSQTATSATRQKASMKIAERYLAKGTALSAKNPITRKLANVAVKSPSLAKAGKFFKSGGGVGVAVISGIGELFTIVPTFTQLGATKGVKQIGKSAVKVAGAAGGWAAGAAVGAAIGSVIPGAGTAIGGIIGTVIGAVCSCVGSAAGTKLADKIVGPSELEKAEQEAQKQQLAMASQTVATTPQASQVSFASNPFNNTAGYLDKDFMGMVGGYVC